MRRNQATLATILDKLSEGRSIVSTCKGLGLSDATFFNWHAMSLKGDSRLLVEWGGHVLQFAEAVKLARARSIVLFESQVRDEVIHGTESVVIEGGKICWAEDERYVGLDDETMTLLGLTSPSIEWNRIKRDAAGNPIPLTRRETAPAHLRIKALSALVPGFCESTRVDVSVRGGVFVAGATAGAVMQEAPRMVDVSPMSGLLPKPPEARDGPNKNSLVVGGVKDRAAFDAEYLGKQRDADTTAEVVFEDAAPEEVKKAEVDPMHDIYTLSGKTERPEAAAAPIVNRPLSELQRDLMDRAARKPEKPPPRSAPNFGAPRSDDPAENGA